MSIKLHVKQIILGGIIMQNKMLIEDVPMPVDAKVKNRQIFEALRKRGCESREIQYIKKLIGERDAYDFSGYSGITTIIIPKNNANEVGYCIKISDNPSGLYNVFVLCNMMARFGFSSNVVDYISTNKDYLITEQIEIPMALNVFKDFRELAKFMGLSLRRFHDVDWHEVKFLQNESEILQSKSQCIIDVALSHEKGLDFLGQYQHDMNYEMMRKYIKEHQKDYISDVMIHGDYNPRNVFTDGEGKIQLVDFADTCFGDRHYDIYFSMWTVALYTGIISNQSLVSECEEIFLTAYGKDKIDCNRLKFCKKLTCMFWQEHNDINTLI